MKGLGPTGIFLSTRRKRTGLGGPREAKEIVLVETRWAGARRKKEKDFGNKVCSKHQSQSHDR